LAIVADRQELRLRNPGNHKLCDAFAATDDERFAAMVIRSTPISPR